jgi:methylated-DNA-[protein]-cysteine S-methyltransferase
MPPDNTSFAAIMPLPFGALGICLRGETLAGLMFLPPGTPAQSPSRPATRQVVVEIETYLNDAGHVWSLAVQPVGTPFRQRVWQLLSRIPSGQTRTYGDLARELGSSARAVGQAVGDNPIPIVIPCHRVIAADGGLGGFNHSRSGYSLDIKRWLLGHEGVL